MARVVAAWAFCVATAAALPAGDKNTNLMVALVPSPIPEEPPMHQWINHPMQREAKRTDGHMHHRDDLYPMTRSAWSTVSTSPPPPPIAFGLMAQEGNCTVTDGVCVQSPNFPKDYEHSSSCKIYNVPAVPLDVRAFDVESHPYCGFDVFTIDPDVDSKAKRIFCGSSGPVGEVSYTGVMTWKTDGTKASKGWKICLGPSPPPTPSAPPPSPPPPPVAFGAMTVTKGTCTVKDLCMMSPNYPSLYGRDFAPGEPPDTCEIENIPYLPLDVRFFDVESDDSCGYDTLSFMKWNTQRKDMMEMKFCGATGPSGMLVPTGKIKWTSDGSIHKTGWQICVGPSPPPSSPAPFHPPPPSPPPDAAMTIDCKGRHCCKLITCDDGSKGITSPGYDEITKQVLSEYYTDVSCVINNVPEKPLKFEQFDVEPGAKICNYDYLEVNANHYCNYASPLISDPNDESSALYHYPTDMRGNPEKLPLIPRRDASGKLGRIKWVADSYGIEDARRDGISKEDWPGYAGWKICGL